MKTLTTEEIQALEVPDLDWLATTVSPGTIKDVNFSVLLLTFLSDLRVVADAAKRGVSLPDEFFVPDLWPVYEQRVLPKKDGEEVWGVCALAMNLARTVYRVGQKATRFNYPGDLFSDPCKE